MMVNQQLRKQNGSNANRKHDLHIDYFYIHKENRTYDEVKRWRKRRLKKIG